MQKKHIYITPEVITEHFLVRDYMMWADISSGAVDPGAAPARRESGDMKSY